MIINSATCPVTFLASFMNFLRLIDGLCSGMEKVSIVSFYVLRRCVQLCTTPMGHFCHLESIFINCLKLSCKDKGKKLLKCKNIFIDNTKKVAGKSIKVLTVATRVYEV